MSPITNWMDSVDAVKQKKLGHLLAEEFYTGAIPFRFIENNTSNDLSRL